MLKSVLSKRRFAKTAFELGNTFPTSSLEDKTSKFYSLEPLKGLEQALAAAEESVVVKLPGPSSYQRLEDSMLEMQQKLQKMEHDIELLKLAPSVLGLVETVRIEERILIENFSPEISNSLKKSKRRISYLRTMKDPKNELAKFFNDPIVNSLEKILISPEWQELESTRNCLAHHRIKDLSEILTIWDRIMRLKIIIKSDPNPNLGIDIFNTCNIIQQLYPSDDD